MGFASPQEVPEKVMQAYEVLVAGGFTAQLR
jgi:hypothetical protein